MRFQLPLEIVKDIFFLEAKATEYTVATFEEFNFDFSPCVNNGTGKKVKEIESGGSKCPFCFYLVRLYSRLLPACMGG
jgi:hypothetical protein